MKKAENFILKDQNSQNFELYKYLNNNVLLVFYPKDNSLVCSVQLKEYSDHHDEFLSLNIKVVGINNGTPDEHKEFCEIKRLNMVLLSDPEMKVIRQFSALYPFNIVKRKLVLISRAAEIILEKNLPPYSYWNHERIIGFLSQKQII